MEGACNDFMDTIKHFGSTHPLECSLLKVQGGFSILESPLRTFLVEALAWEISVMAGEPADGTGRAELILQGGTDAKDFFEMITAKRNTRPVCGKVTFLEEAGGRWGFPSGKPDCTFHVHNDTPICP